MTDGPDFRGVPFTGRRLWTLRARYWLVDHADNLQHRLQRDEHPDDHWLCADYDDLWSRRLVHDHTFHSAVMAHCTPVAITRPPLS